MKLGNLYENARIGTVREAAARIVCSSANIAEKSAQTIANIKRSKKVHTKNLDKR